MPRPSSDRRKLDRFPPQGWTAKVTLPRSMMGLRGGDEMHAPILDLSESGMRLLLTRGVEKGQQIRFKIEDPRFKDVVEWIARIVWVNPPPPIATTWVIGIEFVELPRDQRQKIIGWRSYYTSDEYKQQQAPPSPSE